MKSWKEAQSPGAYSTGRSDPQLVQKQYRIAVQLYCLQLRLLHLLWPTRGPSLQQSDEKRLRALVRTPLGELTPIYFPYVSSGSPEGHVY